MAEWITLGVLVAIAVGVWRGRRAGRARLAAAMAHAYSEGGKAAAAAALDARLIQTVQVGYPSIVNGSEASSLPLSRGDGSPDATELSAAHRSAELYRAWSDSLRLDHHLHDVDGLPSGLADVGESGDGATPSRSDRLAVDRRGSSDGLGADEAAFRILTRGRGPGV